MLEIARHDTVIGMYLLCYKQTLRLLLAQDKILPELWLRAQIFFYVYTVGSLDHGFSIWLQKYMGFIVLTHSFQSLDTENNDIHTHMFRLLEAFDSS